MVLMELLPRVEASTIEKHINSINNIYSSKTIGEIGSSCAEMSFLRQYREELFSPRKEIDENLDIPNEVFTDVILADLYVAVCGEYRELIKSLSQSILRPDDLELIYLMETQMDNAEKEILYEEILSEVGLKLNRYFDWSTHTYSIAIERNASQELSDKGEKDAF